MTTYLVKPICVDTSPGRSKDRSSLLADQTRSSAQTKLRRMCEKCQNQGVLTIKRGPTAVMQPNLRFCAADRQGSLSHDYAVATVAYVVVISGNYRLLTRSSVWETTRRQYYRTAVRLASKQGWSPVEDTSCNRQRNAYIHD